MGNEGKALILVIEDDAAISDVTCSTLAHEGYACTPAYSGTEARLLIEGGAQFDLAICDLMLPGMAGEDVVALIRARSAMPIIVASARSAVVDRVTLLRLGADDYLVKPFDLDELVARVEALLRRAGSGALGAAFAGAGCAAGAAAVGASDAATPSDDPAVRTFGAWRINETERSFEAAGMPLRLTRTEFDIVALLSKKPGRVYDRTFIYEQVWGWNADGDASIVREHVRRIRKKFAEAGLEDDPIETVWGVGYRWGLQ